MKGVTQQFLEENPAIVDEMVLDFVAKKRIADAAKFKEPTDFNIQDNPNLRTFKAYPRLLYHWGTKSTLEVGDRQEHDGALGQGWKEKPWPVDMLDPGFAPTAADSGDTSERLDSLEGRMLDMQQQMAEILDRLPKPKKTETPKG